MKIDFSPVINKEMTILEFASQFSFEDLKAATNTSLDTILDFVKDMNDAQLTHVPFDANADDPHAVEGEKHIGWSLAHLVLHVTASSEEGAAFSSLLARGIPIGGRLRYEADWKTITTKKEVLQRIEESRRMRLAYLDTWPSEPHLDVYRQIPEDSPFYQKIDAPASLLLGLKHEIGHYEQFQEARRQALEATAAAG